LETEESNGDLLFYMEYNNFVATISHPLSKNDIFKAEALFIKFIKKDAPLPITLQKDTARTIKEYFKNSAMKESIPRGIFDMAANEVFKRMKGEQFPKFTKSMFYLSMYNQMMLRKGCELPDELWKGFKQSAEGGKDDGWEYVTETKGVLINKKTFGNSDFNCVRGSGVLPISPEELYVFTRDLPLRQGWEKLYKDAQIIEQLDSKTEIVHLEYKAPAWAKAVFNPHDFVVIKSERREADGSIIVMSRSVVHKDVPVQKGYVRDELEVSGWVIRPCGLDACVVIYLNQVQMGIPKWAEALMMKERPLIIHRVRKFIEKELKESRKTGIPPAWKTCETWKRLHPE